MAPKEASRRGFRLHTRIIPARRLAGLAVVALLVPIHDAAVLGSANWYAASAFAALSLVYCLASWLILQALYSRLKKLNLGTFFLGADVLLLLLAISLTGGPKSWLFFLLAGRCVDQVTFGFRRTVWFNHWIVFSYASVIVGIALRHGGVNWAVEGAKLSALYAFNWYCSRSALDVELLRRRNRKAQLAKRANIELMGTVSHAMRTCLNGIAALADTLQKTTLTLRQRGYVDTMQGSSQTLLSLVSALDSSERPGQAQLEKSRFSPKVLMDEITSLLRPSAEAKGLDFRVEVSETTPHWVQGDVGKIRHILLGLAHNAVRFTEIGFVELRVWKAGSGQVGFQIRDSGEGIAAYMQKRLFSRFVRADGTEWRNYQGQQTGLAISKRLIELMGSTMQLETALGEGTKIRFILDLPESQPAARQQLT